FFCPRDVGPGTGDFIPLAKLTRLEKVLSSVKYFSISSSIGEPLLHPELRQILEWLYRINPTVSVRVTTNGTALTAEKAAWFAGHLDVLSISLNASNGEALCATCSRTWPNAASTRKRDGSCTRRNERANRELETRGATCAR